MADYQLTQTGDEVQDILDNSQTGKYFYNQTVATWSSDATYSDYPYKGTITLNGVKGTDGVEVTFSNADATSGNYSPICNTVANGVEIWAKAQDNGLVIPTIHITTGADVQLSGADSYLPISGGNITGSLSVVGSPVLTEASFPSSSNVQTNISSSITVASGVTLRSAVQTKKTSSIITVSLQFDLTSAKINGNVILSNIPDPPALIMYGLASGNPNDVPVSLDNVGRLTVGGRGASAQTWYSVSFTYAI